MHLLVLKYQKKKELYCCVFRRRGNLETPTRSNIRVRTEQTVFKKPRTCVLPWSVRNWSRKSRWRVLCATARAPCRSSQEIVKQQQTSNFEESEWKQSSYLKKKLSIIIWHYNTNISESLRLFATLRSMYGMKWWYITYIMCDDWWCDATKRSMR